MAAEDTKYLTWEQNTAVRNYLEYLDRMRGDTRSKVSSLRKERIRRILDYLREEIEEANIPINKKDFLMQGKHDIEDILTSNDTTLQHNDVREGFLKHAKAFAEREGITYRAFAEYGVPETDLKEAGI